MSQLPSDYLTNRTSLPSQQATVISARSYLEYLYVDFCFFVLIVNFSFSSRFRIQLSKLFINLVSDDDLHRPGSMYKLIIRYIRQKHPNIVHMIDSVKIFFQSCFKYLCFINRMETLMIYPFGQYFSIVYVQAICNQH